MRVPPIRFAHVRRGKAEEPPGIVGVARVDLKTKVLVRRLEPGDIAVIDDPGRDVLSRLTDGTAVRLDKDTLYNAGDQVIAKGVLLTEASLAAAIADAKAGVPVQIDSFAANTLEFLRLERDLLTNGIDLPKLSTSMKNRHVLVVVRGYRYREDLRALRSYIREYRPVLL